MPADDYCLYHCINYVLSNGGVKPTTAAAMSFREKVVARLRDADLSEQATRLLLPGSAGYPDEPDFAAIAAEAGFFFCYRTGRYTGTSRLWVGARSCADDRATPLRCGRCGAPFTSL